MNNLNVLLKNSPKFKTKIRSNKGIKIIVIHYTGMQSEVDALNRLTDFKSKVSCHYLINEKGQIISIIPDNYTAWHAGKSRWGKLSFLNKYSIGIELVNPGHNFGYKKFRKKQISALIQLIKKLIKKYCWSFRYSTFKKKRSWRKISLENISKVKYWHMA